MRVISDALSKARDPDITFDDSKLVSFVPWCFTSSVSVVLYCICRSPLTCYCSYDIV